MDQHCLPTTDGFIQETLLWNIICAARILSRWHVMMGMRLSYRNSLYSEASQNSLQNWPQLEIASPSTETLWRSFDWNELQQFISLWDKYCVLSLIWNKINGAITFIELPFSQMYLKIEKLSECRRLPKPSNKYIPNSFFLMAFGLAAYIPSEYPVFFSALWIVGRV